MAGVRTRLAPHCHVETKLSSQGGVNLHDHSDILDYATFEQILEMDDDENEREFSKGIVYDFFLQADNTFQKMDSGLYGTILRPPREARLIADTERRKISIKSLSLATSSKALPRLSDLLRCATAARRSSTWARGKTRPALAMNPTTTRQ